MSTRMRAARRGERKPTDSGQPRRAAFHPRTESRARDSHEDRKGEAVIKTPGTFHAAGPLAHPADSCHRGSARELILASAQRSSSSASGKAYAIYPTPVLP